MGSSTTVIMVGVATVTLAAMVATIVWGFTSAPEPKTRAEIGEMENDEEFGEWMTLRESAQEERDSIQNGGQDTFRPTSSSLPSTPMSSSSSSSSSILLSKLRGEKETESSEEMSKKKHHRHHHIENLDTNLSGEDSADTSHEEERTRRTSQNLFPFGRRENPRHHRESPFASSAESAAIEENAVPQLPRIQELSVARPSAFQRLHWARPLHKMLGARNLAANSFDSPRPSLFDEQKLGEFPAFNREMSRPTFECAAVDGVKQKITELDLCDGTRDCPRGEDEAPSVCLFHKVTKNYLKLLSDAFSSVVEDRRREARGEEQALEIVGELQRRLLTSLGEEARKEYEEEYENNDEEQFVDIF